MQKKIILPIILFGGLGMLAACGGGSSSISPAPQSSAEPSKSEPSSVVSSLPSSEVPSSKQQEIKLIDNRVEAYVLVSGEMQGDKFVEYDETEFKSMYSAIEECIVECEPGSYVYRKGNESKRPIYVKQNRSDDYWFYYKDGMVVDGSAPYVSGDSEWYKDQAYTRVLASNGTAKPSYQPYSLKGLEEKTTQAWNRLPLLDAAFRYDPHAFTGIQDTTYTFNLSQAKIRPSYNEAQKVIPMVTMSTTDSYNWSNQGIYMDTDTGNWYYLYGETQSDLKSLTYDGDPDEGAYGVLMTSTWNQEAQEFTPDADVKLELHQIWNEEDEICSNDFKITIFKGDKVLKELSTNYELNTMTMRGTHRAQAALDLIPTDDDYMETEVLPDYMCGGYFKNIVVSEGKGSVRPDLTDEEYMGDEDMCCTPGETYDLLYVDGGVENDSNTKAIIDNTGCVEYVENAENDVWNISFEQKVAEIDRTEEMQKVIDLIKAIPSGADPEDPAVIKALIAYDKLTQAQKYFIIDVEGLVIPE